MAQLVENRRIVEAEAARLQRMRTGIMVPMTTEQIAANDAALERAASRALYRAVYGYEWDGKRRTS